MKAYPNTYQTGNIPVIAVIERENNQAQIIILNNHYYVRMPSKILFPVNQHIVNNWSFYTFVTFDSCVTLRWIGSSNGYYSVSVDLQTI